MLTAILLGTGIAGTAYGYAEEANTDATVEMTDGTTDEFEMEPTVETETKIETESETEAEIETETESESESETETELQTEKKELVENSFRYENGEWIHNEIAMFASGFTPWSFENENWINSLGEPIKGAMEKGIDVSYAQKRLIGKRWPLRISAMQLSGVVMEIMKLVRMISGGNIMRMNVRDWGFRSGYISIPML